MLKDTEREELKQAKPSFPAKLLVRLAELLEQLPQSTRYEFIQNMPLAQFMQDMKKTAPALQDLVFSELVKMRAVDICKLPAVGPARIKQLIGVLEKLLAVEGAQSGSGKKAATDHQDTPVYSSVEAERLVAGVIERVKSSPLLKKISSTKLEEFWDTSIIRAPFIEMLTFRELSEMKVDALLKKRSFGDKKIYALLKAVDACLVQADIEGGAKGIVEGASGVEAGAEAPAPIPTADYWEPVTWVLPSYLKSLISTFEHQHSLCVRLSSPLARVMHAIPSTLRQEEFLVLWLAEEHAPELVSEMLGLNLDETTATMVIARERMVLLMQAHGQPLVDSWDTLLTAAGVPEGKLLKPFMDLEIDANLQCVIGRWMLVAMGAMRPEAYGHPFPGYWTKIEKGLKITIDSVLGVLPVSDDRLRTELSALLPLFNLDELLVIIRQNAYFSEEQDQWVPLS
ncbi:hypothetical protein OAO01_03595 [Oligoflexia bacterium]|nr:hypothetical protein [Oligoflexia bacterium]